MTRVLPSLLLLLALGCSAAAPDTTVASSDGAVTSAASLAAALRATGVTVEDAGMVEQPFFTVPAHVYVVGGEDVQVYEFRTAAEAEQAARQVAPNGGTIGTASMSWMAPPHFFRHDRLIVNYLGRSESTLRALKRLLGPQFAGQ